MSFKPIPTLSGTQANFAGNITSSGDLTVNGGDITLDGAATSTFTIDTSNSFGRELTFSTNGILPTISANSDLLIETSNSDTQIKLEGGSSTDNIQFIANEVEQARITTAGVGIGTTSPTEKLHIESGNLLIKPNAVSASHSGLLLGINKYNSGKAGLYGATDGAASNTDGNLYISTRNVSSSNGSYIKLGQRSSTTTSDKGTIILQAGKYNTNSQTGDILLKYGITDTVTLQGSSGNVGIGTTSPSKKLDVVGDIKSSATVEGVGGVILTSPGGGRFLVTINNSGELQSSSL